MVQVRQKDHKVLFTVLGVIFARFTSKAIGLPDSQLSVDSCFGTNGSYKFVQLYIELFVIACCALRTALKFHASQVTVLAILSAAWITL